MLKIKSRGQSKAVAVHPKQALSGGISVALPTLNLGAGRGWVFSTTPKPL